jgi:hypothetical protein
LTMLGDPRSNRLGIGFIAVEDNRNASILKGLSSHSNLS